MPAADRTTALREVRALTVIAVPLAGAYLAEVAMVVITKIIAGKLGHLELAAVGLTADWFYVLLLIGMGVIAIVGVLVAQSHGERNNDGIRTAAEQGLIVAAICSIPVIAAVWFLAPALSYARQDPEVDQGVPVLVADRRHVGRFGIEFEFDPPHSVADLTTDAGRGMVG